MKLTEPHYIIFLLLLVVLSVGMAAYFLFVPEKYANHVRKPNIIIIMADDMGRNDVGFHGSNQIPTPNIDALAYNGIILDKFYTQCSCTPSRAALLTGKYPMRLGLQGLPIRAGENKSLPVDDMTLPQHLKHLGYKTHLVGKWHLGFAHRANLPLERGFDTHFGYWNGFIGYFNYTAIYELPNDTIVKGFDLYDGMQPDWSSRGKYATDLFTEKAVEIIDKHNTDEPLFLFLSHLAPHTGEDGVELEVPNVTLAEEKYSYIEDPRRRLYADIINRLDASVGRVVAKLSEKSLLENSIIFFSSDNGAQTIGVYENSGSNWPLRGIKLTEFEGGIRTAAAIFSPLFKTQSYVNKHLIHMTDLLPTFYAAAGGNLADLGKIDGVNQWETLTQKFQSQRSEILVNINEADNVSAIITNNGQYKLLQGTHETPEYENYYGDSGRGSKVPTYNLETIFQSVANQAIQNTMKSPLTSKKIFELRNQTDLAWCRTSNKTVNCKEGCLFDLEKDPCETTNIIDDERDVAEEMLQRLAEFSKELVPQQIGIFDAASNPVHYNETWCTWLDEELCSKKTQNAR